METKRESYIKNFCKERNFNSNLKISFEAIVESCKTVSDLKKLNEGFEKTSPPYKSGNGIGISPI